LAAGMTAAPAHEWFQVKGLIAPERDIGACESRMTTRPASDLAYRVGDVGIPALTACRRRRNRITATCA
jgi:hypothetical protein